MYIWKRAQILVAETWAAFYPEDPSAPHPLFPAGPAIHELTMFADYRVPQILHHLRAFSDAQTPLLWDSLAAADSVGSVELHIHGSHRTAAPLRRFHFYPCSR